MVSRVTAIIPAYNAEAYLREAVESLLATQYPALEIVVVEDGSTDRTLDVARTLAAAWPSVRLVQHPDAGNHGEAASRDLGIARASGEYICFLDADDFVYPNRFSVAVPILDRRPEVDGVCETTQRVVAPGGERRAPLVREQTVFECEDPDAVLEQRLFGRLAWSVNAILLRRRALQRVGGFGSRLRNGADAVLWLKLASVCVLVPGSREPVCAYRIHDRNVSNESALSTVFRPVNTYVLSEAVRWARRARIPPAKQALLDRALKARLLDDSAQLRAAHQPWPAVRLLAATCARTPAAWSPRAGRSLLLAILEGARVRRCNLPRREAGR